jgi:hypothetical protein
MRTNTICIAKAFKLQKSLPQNSTNARGEHGVKIIPMEKTKSVKIKEKTKASGK